MDPVYAPGSEPEECGGASPQYMVDTESDGSLPKVPRRRSVAISSDAEDMAPRASPKRCLRRGRDPPPLHDPHSDSESDLSENALDEDWNTDDNDESESDLPDEAEDYDSTTTPKPQAKRQVYLWTFSRTSVRGRKTPEDFTRESFSATLMRAYKECYPNNAVVQFFTVRERHASGSDEQRDWHYHTVVMTETVHRYLPIKNYLLDYEATAVHASCTHTHYYTAFRYLILPSLRKPRDELDDAPFESAGHPSRREAARVPRTAAASNALTCTGTRKRATNEAENWKNTPEMGPSVIGIAK